MASYLEHLFTGRRPLSLRTVGFPQDLVALMLGPHPDDFDAIGVTLRILRENENTLFAAVVRGGSGVEDSFCTPPTPERKAAIREEEQRQSAHAFGLPDSSLRFLNLDLDDEAQPLDTPANVEALRLLIEEIHPDLVFLPHGIDTNIGHQRMGDMFRRVAWNAGYPFAGLFNRDPKTTRIRVDAFTPFGAEEAEWKRQLLLFHDSQHRRNLNTRRIGFDERILNFNRQTAREIPGGGEYAEAFELEFFAPAAEPTPIAEPPPAPAGEGAS